MEEKLYTIPLSKAKASPKVRRAQKAIKIIKEYLHRYLNADMDSIHMDSSINEMVWSRGNKQIPTKIRVRIVQSDEGIIEASLPGVKTRSEIEAEVAEKKASEEKEKEAEKKQEKGKEAEKKQEKGKEAEKKQEKEEEGEQVKDTQTDFDVGDIGDGGDVVEKDVGDVVEKDVGDVVEEVPKEEVDKKDKNEQHKENIDKNKKSS